MNYEGLLQEANNSAVYVIEKASFKSKSKGLIKNDVIGLNKTLKTDTERACVLAEELGHYHTTTGDILEQSDTANRKQERFARLWAYNKLVGLHGILDAYKRKCSSRFEIAQFLGVTEEFFEEAIQVYAEKYGPYIQLDNYVIFFTPNLAIMELM